MGASRVVLGVLGAVTWPRHQLVCLYGVGQHDVKALMQACGITLFVISTGTKPHAVLTAYLFLWQYPGHTAQVGTSLVWWFVALCTHV